MAKANLPVDFTDDVLNESMSGRRRYKLIYNEDGTVSLEDVTAYNQIGSNFGSKQVNETNEAVNAAADAGKIIDSLATARAVTEEGYIAGALALKELDDSLNVQKISEQTSITNLVPQVLAHGTRKMFYATRNTFFSDFPSALSSVATLSPMITITRLDGVHVLIEIVAFGANNGIPKSIKGCCNWNSGVLYWGDVY